MRVISRRRLREFWERHAAADAPLTAWYKVVRGTSWRGFAELRQTFPRADNVRVRSGNTVTVFDVGGNNYRVIAKVDYKKQIVFALKILTHAEYDKNKWKDQL